MANGRTSTSSLTLRNPTASPVSKLTEDILWLIFMINTVSYSPSDEELSDPNCLPLNIARLSSQVCHQWRHVLLKTSSVWARLLDWRSLNQETDDWRNEVLGRTGTSLLWIGGHDETDSDEPKDSTLLFFHRLVVDHWERIERLMQFPTQYERIDGLRYVVQRPAPNLKMFAFPDSPRDYHEFEGSMFAGQAPRLRVFHAMGTRCHLEIAWMSNIRELALGRLFNNKVVCRVLTQLPRLEILELDGHTIIDGYQPPVIHLPELRVLKLWACISYVACIKPHPGCALLLWQEGQTDRDPFEVYTQAISTLIHNNISMHPAKRAYLECRTSIFTLSEAHIDHSGHFSRKDETFDITICPDTTSSFAVIERLLLALESPYFSTTLQMTLACDVMMESTRVCQAFNRFCSHFSGLEILSLHPTDINMLLNDGCLEHLLFPKLHTLILLGLGSVENRICWIDPFTRYLSYRRDRGFPITTIDLRTELCFQGGIPKSLECLDSFAGMKILWK
ncbi:hypothetical protein JR316_0013450 [Psilocybe cubensis]|uniref:Uncharacterized protein n=2 Tax=Psilocybe cubensis TaxID=181762 RepID=A0ACB8GFY2_PSICU|nr:uncharacterized protein JR316_0013450 [Psilocybe cubensis]KAH9474287.1 hypothetical protein JR316_0013450 [Psilocybe cubensis]